MGGLVRVVPLLNLVRICIQVDLHTLGLMIWHSFSVFHNSLVKVEVIDKDVSIITNIRIFDIEYSSIAVEVSVVVINNEFIKNVLRRRKDRSMNRRGTEEVEQIFVCLET
jgi:hypothetical protein